MKVLYLLVPFVLLGIGVAYVAFRGGPSGVRDAAGGGRRRGRGVKIALVLLYVGAGIAVPAAIIAGRNEAEGGVGPLTQEQAGTAAQGGKQLFKQTCASCHNLDAVNARGVTGPDLDEIGQVTKQRVLNAVRIGGTGDKRMPAGLLTGENADAVAAYVAKVAGQGH
jgi:mono/diheme cytochrome c family protein